MDKTTTTLYILTMNKMRKKLTRQLYGHSCDIQIFDDRGYLIKEFNEVPMQLGVKVMNRLTRAGLYPDTTQPNKNKNPEQEQDAFRKLDEAFGIDEATHATLKPKPVRKV